MTKGQSNWMSIVYWVSKTIFTIQLRDHTKKTHTKHTHNSRNHILFVKKIHGNGLPIWGFLRSSRNTNPNCQGANAFNSGFTCEIQISEDWSSLCKGSTKSSVKYQLIFCSNLWPVFPPILWPSNWAWHTWHTQEFVQCMRFLFPLFLTRSNWWHTRNTRNPFLQHLSIPKVTLHQLSRLSIPENSWYLKSWKFIWLNIMAIASDLI